MPSTFQRALFGSTVALLVGAFAACSCAIYHAPPTVSIVGLESGVLYDSKAPLRLDFGLPVEPSTVRMKIATLTTNLEGELGDEDTDPSTELEVLASHDPDVGDVGGVGTFEADDRVFTFTPQSALPVGPKLVLLVEPEVRAKGDDARVRHNRTRIPFSYAVRCSAGAATNFQSGVYFFLLEVEEPLGTQIQLFGSVDVDPASGAFYGQFTNADRNPALTCPSACASTEVCRTLPAPACVAPSTKAAAVDEYPDFLPNATPPVGYSFAAVGCVADAPDGTGVSTAPATMVVESPPVTVAGLIMTGFFANPRPGEQPRASGSLTADSVLLGQSRIGAGKGTMRAVRVPDDRVPPGVPPAERPDRDAGARGGDDATTSDAGL